jgi:transcription elongation factor GreA
MAKSKSSKNTADSSSINCTLVEASTRFFITLSPESRLKTEQRISKFIRWYGEKRLLNELTAPEMSNYVEHINSSGTNPADNLEPVKDFLSYCYKEGLIGAKLAPQIKFKKSTAKLRQSSQRQSEKTISLTAQGHADLEAELITLKDERPRVIEEIRKAAADKDFRENAPLAAAREYQGHLEGRIKELEDSLKKATIMNEGQAADHKIRLGDTVVLRDLSSGEQITYTLVDIREASLAKGKISAVSPIGKAVVGRTKGDSIEVVAPAGVLPYKIEDIKQS